MNKMNEKINILKQIGMTDEERVLVLNKIMDYADFNPERVSVSSTEGVRLENSRGTIWTLPFSSLILNKKSMSILASVLILAMLGGGTSFAAEGSLPGDILYPVKVGVNENVRAVLALGAEADAEWEAEKTERRLEEAELLALKGKLDDEKRAYLESRIEEHVKRFEEKSEEVEDENKTEIKGSLEAKLSAHSKVLSDIKLKVDEKFRDEVEKMKVKTESEVKVAAGKREKEESKYVNASVNSESGASFDGQYRSVEAVVSNLENKILNIEDKSDLSIDTEAKVKVEKAKSSLIEARSKFDSGEKNDAYESLFNSRRDAMEAKVLIARIDFIRARSSIDADADLEKKNTKENVDSDKKSNRRNNDNDSDRGDVLDSDVNVDINVGSSSDDVDRDDDNDSVNVEGKFKNKSGINVETNIDIELE